MPSCCPKCKTLLKRKDISFHTAHCNASPSITNPLSGPTSSHVGTSTTTTSSSPSLTAAITDSTTNRLFDETARINLPADVVPIENENVRMVFPCPHCSFQGRTRGGVNVHICSQHGLQWRKNHNNPSHSQIQSVRLIPLMERCTENEQRKPFPSLTSSISTKWQNVWSEWRYSWSTAQVDLNHAMAMFDRHMELFVHDVHLLDFKLPGPIHPATKHRRIRRQAAKKNRPVRRKRTGFGESSNPQRSDKEVAVQRRQEHARLLLQYQMRNCRQSAASRILNPDAPRCSIETVVLENTYANIYGAVNDNILPDDNYISPTDEEQRKLDETYEETFSPEDAVIVMKKIGFDKSAGPDGVLRRSIRAVDPNGIMLADMATTVQQLGYYPAALRKAHTTMLYKNGEISNPSNWRPITVFSILRRIIGKMFEFRLRRYVVLSEPQKGFVNQPGCLENIDKLSRMLNDCHQSGRTFNALLLDIRKAFDTVGHLHLKLSLSKVKMPTALRRACSASIEGNSTQIKTTAGLTKLIDIRSGVAQGEPLSPILFNLAIDHILARLHATRADHGVEADEDKCAVLGFADDTAVISDTLDSLNYLFQTARQAFEQIGLTLNTSKTQWLHIPDSGDAVPELFLDATRVTPCDEMHLVRYLGAYFGPQQQFNETVALANFSVKLENLVKCELIRSDQKLQLLQQYLMPIFYYSFQITPTTLVSTTWLRRLDDVVRSAARDILQLPMNTCKDFYYATRKYRGLALVRYEFEAPIQRFQAVQLLLRACENSRVMPELVNKYEEEIRRCVRSVRPEMDELTLNVRTFSSACLRSELRDEAFNAWAARTTGSGYGVSLFRNVPASNRWLTNKGDLYESDWKVMLKASISNCENLANPRMAAASRLCRKCLCCIETLAHITGSCEANNGMIINRHNDVVRRLAKALRDVDYTVDEEMRCVGSIKIFKRRDAEGQVIAADSDALNGEEPDNGEWEITEVRESRRVDIFAVNKQRTKAYVLDPTIRFESTEEAVLAALEEKKRIYNATVPDLRQRTGVADIEVVGIWFGSRGALHPSTVELFRRLGSGRHLMEELSRLIIRHTSRIIAQHVKRK